MTTLVQHRPSSASRLGAFPSTQYLTRPSSFSGNLSAYSSLSRRPRPLSSCSTLSAISIASSASASSVTGERRRRSAALLDLEAGECEEGGIRNSLLRAEEVLRASERERELERRRDRAGFRARQVHSAHLLEHVWAGEEDATEDLSFPVPIPASSTPEADLAPAPVSQAEEAPILPAQQNKAEPNRRSSLKRFSPKQLLRKARSIPVDILFSPAAQQKRWSNESSASETSPSPRTGASETSPSPRTGAGEAVPSIPHPPSRPSPAPRRAVSSSDLLTTASSGLPRPSATAQRSRYDSLPLSHLPHLSTSSYAYLGPPDTELPSKFSASSGDSIIHLVSFGGGGKSSDPSAAATAGKGPKGFKNRARTFSKASTDGLKNPSLKGRSLKAKDKSMRKKPSLANLFSGFGSGGGSGDEQKRASASGGESSGADKKKGGGRAISFASSKIPAPAPSAASSSTSGHRPSTSISSFAGSTTTNTSDSHASATAQQNQPSRKPSRLGFFRSALRDSSTSGSSGGHNGSTNGARGSIRARTISRPLSVATSADGASSSPLPSAFDRRCSAATGSSASASVSAGEASAPHTSDTSEKKRMGWASKIRGAMSARAKRTGNVAAKRALFERRGGSEETGAGSPMSGGDATVLVGDKVTLTNSRSPPLTSRLPSRIPLANVFPQASSAAVSAQRAPARPPRPPSDLQSSDDTTFYGHRVPAVKSRAAAIEALATVKSNAPRVRLKTSIPVAKSHLVPFAASAQQPAPPVPRFGGISPPQQRQQAATLGYPGSSNNQLARAHVAMLFPPLSQPNDPTHSLPNRRWTPDSFEASSSGSPTSFSSGNGNAFTIESFPIERPASPFRSPSPARFRDLLPSATAQSSPDRNERGLPLPLDASPISARGTREKYSPKKRAMGPEQVIVMEDAKQPSSPIAEVRYATTDLADILSSLDDTEDVDVSGLNRSLRSNATRSFRSSSSGSASFVLSAVPVPPVPPVPRPHLQQDTSDLSASLRCHLPHLDSIESLRSTVSDVPADLKELINTVDDHISLHSLEGLSPALFVEGQSMGARGFADEGVEGFSEPSSGTDSDEEEDEGVDHMGGRELGDGTAFGAIGMGAFLAAGDHTTGAYSSDGGGPTATLEYDANTASFIGNFSTAGEVLRSVLAAGQPSPLSLVVARGLVGLQDVSEAEEDENGREDPRALLRESVRDALDLGRPSHGDKMFERDEDVQLSALLGSPTPPLSPEQQASQTAFFRNHLRNGSAFSSTEGSLESHFTLSGSPTPYPRSGRPLRQSLARYSQDHSPTKRPSHRARPISEQSIAPSSDQDHLPPPNDLTALSLAQSSRSTNLSISSVSSSPCPVPKNRRIPMLTRIPPLLPLQPSFRFPPEKPSSATVTLSALGSPIQLKENPMDHYTRQSSESSAEETGNLASGTIKNFCEAVARPRLLELHLKEDACTPPDTPPPSSPSDGERGALFNSHQFSFNLDCSVPPSNNKRRSDRSTGGARHSRQVSRSSSILKSTIVEEEDHLTVEYPESPTNATVELAIRLHLQPLSPIVEPDGSVPLSPSPQKVPASPYTEPPSVTIHLSSHATGEEGRVVELDADAGMEEASDPEEGEAEFEFTAETALETTRAHVYLRYEADMEVKRSQARWPDTDASREAVAFFNAPRTYHAKLEFLFYSQSRWPSPPHLLRFNSFVPPLYDDPPTPPSPIRIPSPIVDSSFETDWRDLILSRSPSPAPPPRRRPAPPPRRVLGEKLINQQVAALSSSTSSPSKAPKKDHSPFTALPPRLGSKLRAVRAKMSSSSAASGLELSTSPKPKKVDTSFLGSRVSSRRQEQLEAAMRRLEGTGKPSEQRSDGESTSDFTAVLEAVLEAAGDGELTGELKFSKFVSSPPTHFLRRLLTT
ncbi:hypothetical protein JCM11251_006823 [Rhodosporidiobolus azoricus]